MRNHSRLLIQDVSDISDNHEKEPLMTAVSWRMKKERDVECGVKRDEKTQKIIRKEECVRSDELQNNNKTAITILIASLTQCARFVFFFSNIWRFR